jgi:hypothetical protein
MIRKIYNMAQVTKKRKIRSEKESERKNIIIINFLKRNG